MSRVECYWVGSDRYTCLEWALEDARARGVTEIYHEITINEIYVIEVSAQ